MVATLHTTVQSKTDQDSEIYISLVFDGRSTYHFDSI